MSDVVIPDDELSVEALSWGNGQHVGTRTGVKVTHIPSGLIAICETQRSQHKNKRIAIEMLIGGLTCKDMP